MRIGPPPFLPYDKPLALFMIDLYIMKENTPAVSSTATAPLSGKQIILLEIGRAHV